jgi:DNA-binding transcriptional MerR regulator
VGTSTVFTIGELARRTGLPVKTIRFYSDEGLLPPTDRTPAGYRLYDTKALARLELVRTLRELGLGLADVERALTRQATVPQLAARHVEALDEQIRRLRLRRSVLRAVAKRGSELEEVKLMSKLASMSDEERRRLIDEFWDEVSTGLDLDPEFYERMRSAKPDLPDDPSPEQLEAWIELAELVRDKDFRALVRGMGQDHHDRRSAGEDIRISEAQREHWFSWVERAQAAVDAGEPPDSATGRELAADIATESAAESATGQDPADPDFRARAADRIAAGSDPRAERYWQLLATINGWSPIPTRYPAVQWLIATLRVNPQSA